MGNERALGKAMVGLYHEAKNEGYNASYFLRMISELGPVETARRLVTPHVYGRPGRHDTPILHLRHRERHGIFLTSWQQ